MQDHEILMQLWCKNILESGESIKERAQIEQALLFMVTTYKEQELEFGDFC